MVLGLPEQLMAGPAAVVDWERESYPAYGDFLALPLFFVFFPAVRFLLDRFVFETVARRLILGKSFSKVDYETEETQKKITKFKESAWKCIYFLLAELLALLVTYNEPWFSDSKYFWIGPGEQVWPDQKTKFKLKAVYMFSAGFYTYSIFALMFWETRRSDFGVSMSHHVATVLLIVLSYLSSFMVYSSSNIFSILDSQKYKLRIYLGCGQEEAHL
ncbi:hypothetical protein ABZP36_007623 [Zizania latifolia]